MDTKEYRTRTIFKEADNKCPDNNIWPIGLDVGYSGIKVVSGNEIACIPAYAAEDDSSSLTINVPGMSDTMDTIKYKDENGNIWNVGRSAQNAISVSDTTAGSLAAFGRNRYFSPAFKVFSRVGMAAGLLTNQYGSPEGKRIMIQTGLPTKYIKSDTSMLVEALAGRHQFSVKFGAEPWKKYDFTLAPEDILVKDQPMGTLFSLSADKNFQKTPDANSYFSSRVLILDPGFGTFDTFPVIRGSISRDNCQTFEKLGMKQVMKDTCDEIYDTFNFEVSVPAIQQFLETGKVFERKGRAYNKVDFGHILEKHSKDICRKAMDTVMDIYNPLVEFDYMVITGGTGAAWSNYIRDYEDLRNSTTVQLVSGNKADPSLPYLFQNARGYYVFLCNQSSKFSAKKD